MVVMLVMVSSALGGVQRAQFCLAAEAAVANVSVSVSLINGSRKNCERSMFNSGIEY